ncbi:tetratricopeptide repeat protein [Dactylosporangium sp. AC04546]|uniref:tetratricopeptide repeat protein n=1 Tax=Dactylosporangium sp. AC04546 TaxID=2862460 RepID=UPI001EDDE1C5|nr:tetratricopeptide repeat protein [Dactylosporangium sp. AC04546]WVK88423.1 tetratricopeptide repeat protein [Dactylosporangium sp. AC04546]
MTFDEADGAALIALADTEQDLDLVEEACAELARRIERGDLMIGILPLDAARVVVGGLSTAGRAGRPRAWITLGRCYLGLNGHLLDPAEWPTRFSFPDDGGALRCFGEAAALGDRDGALLFARAAREASPEAQEQAADFLRPYLGTDHHAEYQYGLVQQWLGDPAAAVGHHERAAAQGNADAAFELYVLYATGDGVAPDGAAAHHWLLRAAETGQPRALYNVAAGHATGNGFPQDSALAVAYYERSARAGNPRAAATLGVMYLTADGVEEDPAAAARWFGVADDLGYPVDGWLDQLGLRRPRP